jgi:hypothetical protein
MTSNKALRAAFIASVVAAAAAQPSPASANFVLNGDFESSTTIAGPPANGIGHIDKLVNLPSWTKTCLNQCGNGPITEANSHGYAFVVDNTSATRPGGGFGAIYNNITTPEQLYFWGPSNSTSNSSNGFAGSPNGGKFVAIDGDFGRAKLSQVISGLDTTKTYTFSFEYAGAQQGLNTVDFSGDTAQKWFVDGITASQITVGPWTNSSRGFTSWQTYSTTFTPQSSSINLAFTPWGNVVGGGEPSGIDSLPPFLLLDNVQILESTPPGPPTPPPPGPGTNVPGPLSLLGVGAAGTMARRLRRRLKMAG